MGNWKYWGYIRHNKVWRHLPNTSEQTEAIGVEIKLFNMNGEFIEEVYVKTTNFISKECLSIKNDLASGIYILRLFNGTNCYTSKIIKQ